MELSDALIRRFSKATEAKTADTGPKETYIYGTINSIHKEEGEDVFDVVLDGSTDNVTPVHLSGVQAGVNDRVLVLMKNRTPQIVSNLSNKVINSDYLEGGDARFTGVITVLSPNGDLLTIGGAYDIPTTSAFEVYNDRQYNHVAITGWSIWVGEPGSGGDGTFITKNGVSTSSDRDMKREIEDLDYDLALRLIPVRFKYKSRPSQHYGFIAQDVQDVMPDAVSIGRNNKYALNYNEFIAPTLALAQHNHDEIEALKKEVEELRKEVKELGEAKHNHLLPDE